MHLAGFDAVSYILQTITVALLFAVSLVKRKTVKDILLRDISALVYVSHMWIVLFFEKVLKTDNLLLECALCAATVTVFSIVVIRSTKKAGWLKKMY